MISFFQIQKDQIISNEIESNARIAFEDRGTNRNAEGLDEDDVPLELNGILELNADTNHKNQSKRKQIRNRNQ